MAWAAPAALVAGGNTICESEGDLRKETPMKPAPACDTTQPDIQNESPDQARAAAEALTDRVLHALERVTWPAHPDTLVESAEENGAPPDVIEALRNLPEEAYGNFAEVSALIVAARLSSRETARGEAAARK
jgi:hypothetical protein